MYRLPFKKLLNNSSSIFAKKSTNMFYNAQKYNVQAVGRNTQTVFVNNSITSLRRNCSQHTDSAESDTTYNTLAKSYREQRRVPAHSVFNVLDECNIDVFSNAQSLLLLQCCGEAIVDKAPSERSELCNQVWAKLQESVFLDLQHYNKYLEVCIENKVKLDYLDFISKMKNYRPNVETYHLLLQCACQIGDIPQAVKIISEMKIHQIPIGERTFNALILGNAIYGGWTEAIKVLNTMQTIGIVPSSLTYWHLLRGVSELKNDKDFMKVLQIHPGESNEQEFLKLLHVLGLHGNHMWIDQVTSRVRTPVLTKEGLLRLQLLCIHLVHMKQSEAAFYYYRKFGLPLITQEESKHSAFLFAEMLSCGVPVRRVIEMMKTVRDIDYTYTIHTLTGFVLKRRLIAAAWDLFLEMPYLRPHFFWPILLQAASDDRENGVFAVIKRMFDLGVKPDGNTLELYILPYCDTSDPKSLLLRLKQFEFTLKELLTPLISFLLKNHQLDAAENLCFASGNISIDPERLIQPLCRAWIDARNSNSTIQLLKRISSAKENRDYLGKFVMQAFKICKTPANYNHFLLLIKAMHDQEMKILTTSAESICYYLNNLSNATLAKTIETAVETLVDDGLSNTSTIIPHPKNMSIEEQENHLIELKNKSMETRGILRKLIQNYCRLGNETRVRELRQQFIDAGYNETAGMKASLFHIYITKGFETGASNLYNEIKLQHPNFAVDDFKVIDFATLLLQKNQYDVAIKVLTENRAIQGGPNIIRNCWCLLSAVDEENRLYSLYKLLIEKGYCVPGNVILGPMIKMQIKSGNLKKAVQLYGEFARKYKCTPLQVELLCALVENKNEELLHKALNITSTVHGPDGACISIISTLSQVGYHESLRKCLLELSIVPTYKIGTLCDRLIESKDVSALETLAKAVYNFPPEKFDETIVYNYLMKMYGINNDCESAVKFYRELLDQNVNVPAKLTQELLQLVHRCKYIVPEDLVKEPVSS